MRDRYNADLANGLGNFAARVLTLAEKAEVKFGKLDGEFEEVIASTKRTVAEKIAAFRFSEALAAIWAALALGDRYVNEKKVWEIKDDAKRTQALFNLVSLLDNIAAMIAPFMPETSRRIAAAIAWKGDVLKVAKPEILFPRIK